jgi:4-hydroxy-2-oxoheptanedioate aldolase
MKKNKLRKLLDEGRPTIGTRLHSIWPATVEAVGHSGMFDYVEFLAEYAPFDLFALDNFCRAVELFDMSAIIKVEVDQRVFQAQRGIGSGFHGVLFADVLSANEAADCVRIMKPDTPADKGGFGVAMRRFSYMGYGGSSKYIQTLRDNVIMVMIEKQAAVDHLDEILEVPGLDMIQWGPADYSMNTGRAGEKDHPEVKAAERLVIEKAIRAGIPPRAEINHPDQAKYYLDIGVRHFSLGVDLMILFHWWKEYGDNLRTIIANE